MKKPHPADHDVIVIGSGIGGMAAAVLLAKVFHKRVCVLEQHWTAGGQTHAFTRQGGRYEWDVGIHYIGDVHTNLAPARLLRFLGGDRLRWRRLDPAYDRIRFRDHAFDYVAGREQIQRSLGDAFPDEREAINRYWSDLSRSMRWSIFEYISRLMPGPFGWATRAVNSLDRNFTQQTTADYLRKHFRSPVLRNLLAAQWGDYGLPPETSAFEIHAMVSNSYLLGAVYPEGGSRHIAEVLLDELQSHGGCCLTNTRVNRIHTSGNRVQALEISSKHLSKNPRTETVTVNKVISDVGAFNTYRRLLDQPCFDELDSLPWHSSMLVLFFTLDCDPRDLGFTDANYWLHDCNADGPFESVDSKGAFLSFTSLKQGLGQGGHYGEIVMHTDPSRFDEWRHTRWKNRGADYDDLKRSLCRELIETVGSFYPELLPHITTHELSTPLSLEFFTQHNRGNPYGVPFVPNRHRYPFCRPQTPYRNLFLAGQDVFCLGFVGALMGGVFGATASQPVGFPRVLRSLLGYEFRGRGRRSTTD